MDNRKKRSLTPQQKRAIAKRRAARRRKVYLFRTVFVLFLIAIIWGIIKAAGFIFEGKAVTAANTSAIEQEKLKESIDASAYDFIVCLDPGHGYDDEGTSSTTVKNAVERDIVFDLALRVKEILNDNDIGVILTHTTNKVPSDYKGDQYLFGVEKRVSYANTLDIDFYVSIHCDYFQHDSSINGSRVYYLEGSSMEGIAGFFSDSIMDSMKSSAPMLMPMAQSDAYYVLRYTTVPSVLIETGFLSNKQESKDMMTEKWRKNMAQGIADGIIDAHAAGSFESP